MTTPQELRDQGIDPFPAAIKLPQTLDLNAIINLAYDTTEFNDTVYSARGRLISINSMGFAKLRDEYTSMQIYAPKKEEYHNLLLSFNVGDLVWVQGTLMRTKTNELTLRITELKLAAKISTSFPDQFHTELDPEIKARQPYIDFLVNPSHRDTFYKRARMMLSMREYLHDIGFMEVETPILHPIPGGASAQPFITHHNALNADFYLRIAPELYLKRLIVSGFNSVYEISRNFRNEGISTKHNPEFTAIELYKAWIDYEEMMKIVEDIILVCDEAINPRGSRFTFTKATMSSLISKYTDIPEDRLRDATHIQSVWKDVHNQELNLSWANWWVKLFDTHVEHHLTNPTFVTGFPAEISPLARPSDSDPELADRFELYIHGMEIANGFNELNDPELQSKRFLEQAKLKGNGDVEAMHYDEDYIKALSFGMPPTAGAGIGIDRLVMILTESFSIRDVLLFPTVKPLQDKT